MDSKLKEEGVKSYLECMRMFKQCKYMLYYSLVALIFLLVNDFMK